MKAYLYRELPLAQVAEFLPAASSANTQQAGADLPAENIAGVVELADLPA